MAWFKVDDSFPDHPKLELLERYPVRYMAAVTVWVLMGADCARRLTNGFCRSDRVRKVCSGVGNKAIVGAEALVEVGLWEREADGYRFKHWDEYQPAKADVEQRRAQKTARQRRWRESRDERLRRRAVDASTKASVVAPPSPPIPSHAEVKISDPVCSAPSSLGTARAANGAQAPAESVFTADRMALVFQRAYLDARQTAPSMGGRNIGEFHRRVCATAEARSADPETLFREVLTRYLAEPANSQIAQIVPYANFATRFESLLEGDADARKRAELERFREEVSAMLPRRGNRGHDGSE